MLSSSRPSLLFRRLATLHHTDIPDGQSGYGQGWRDNYFDPMQALFTKP
jgi:hypothetical protein